MRYLLDTNIISEARKPKGDINVKSWIANVPENSLYLSVLVFGEIEQGIERLRRRGDTHQVIILTAWLQNLKLYYANNILPVSLDVAEEWGRLNVPNPLPVIDGLLAATVRVHKLVLVTRNTSDFERTGIPLLNPFDNSSQS